MMLCKVCAPINFDNLFELVQPTASEDYRSRQSSRSDITRTLPGSIEEHEKPTWQKYTAIPQNRHVGKHHACYKDLVLSVQNGCDLCSVLLMEDILRRRCRFTRFRSTANSGWEHLRGKNLMTEEDDGSLRVTVPHQLAPEPRGPWSYRARPRNNPQILYYIQFLKGAVEFDESQERVETRRCGESVTPPYLIFYEENEALPPGERLKTLNLEDKDYEDDEFLARLPISVEEGVPLVSDFIRRRPQINDLKSHVATNLIQNWIKACEGNHPQCGIPNNPVLPTRVIDVGPSDGSQEPKLFLTRGSRGHWIALSHCWGKVKPRSSTVATETMMQQGITGLPPTFHDAVFITRQLGIRYLWIDSLCILQDSKEDWMAESAKMGRVYSEAVLSLQVNAPDCSKSVLQREFLEKPWLRIPFIMPSRGLWGQVYLGYRASDGITIPSSAVNKRAWCLQENILSTRTLACGENGLIWSCRQDFATERCPRPFRNWDWSWKVPYGDILRWQLKVKVWNSVPEDLIQNYYYLVSEYMARKITYYSDRLIAWSAIARETANKTGWSYCAGLWKEDMHRGLLWSCDDRNKAISTTSDFTAPTWSWASVSFERDSHKFYDGTSFVMYNHIVRNFFQDLDHEFSCKIIDAQTSLLSGDIYSQISSAKLVIQGRWRPSEKLHKSKMPHFLMGGSYPLTHIPKGEGGSGRYTDEPAHSTDLYLGFSKNDDRTIVCDLDTKAEKRLPDGYSNYQPSEDEKRQSRDWSKVSYLQIAKWRSEIIPGGTIWALMLESDDNEMFRRMGLAQISDEVAAGWEMRTVKII